MITGGFHIGSVEGGQVQMTNTKQGETTEEDGVLVTSLTVITEKPK